MSANILPYIKNILFPKYCVHCLKVGSFLCPNCYQQITFYPLEIKLDIQQYEFTLIAMTEYDEVIKKLITTLKYNNVKEIAITLANMIYETTAFKITDIITAVPLHPKKERERGFNQVEAIALHLSKLINKPYVPLLIRTVNSKAQAKIKDKAKRQTRLQNVFAINPAMIKNLQSTKLFLSQNPLITPTQNQSILIIDDVITTGSTLQECAKVLFNAGWHNIHALTVTRKM